MAAQSIESRMPAAGAIAEQALAAVRSLQTWLNSALPRRDWYGLLVLLGACWLALRPYLFTHDGRLYALQALAGIYPELTLDPTLQHFNQGRLSLFTPLYSALVAKLGLWPAAWLIYVLSQTLYFVALATLVAWLLPNRRLAVITLALLVSTGGSYPPGIFGYAESFVSARLVASAFTLSALAAALHQRWVGAVLLLLAATAMHPLMALAGWLLLGWWLGREWLSLRLMLALTVLGSLLVVLVALTLPTMSPRWLAIVTARSEYLFITRWPAHQWAELLSVGVVAWLGLGSEHVRLRRLSEALLLLLLTAVLFSLVAAWHPNSWLLALQPWRAFWLVAIGEWLLVVHWLSRPARHQADLAAQAALLGGLSLGTAYTPLLLMFIPLARHGARAARTSALWSYLTLALLALALIMVVLTPLVGYQIAQRQLATAAVDYSYLELLPKLRTFFLMPVVVAGVVLMMVRRWTQPRLIASGSALLLLVAAALYDRESRHQEAADAATVRALQQRIAPTAQVYWPEHVSQVWFELQRPSYASRWQGAPGVFSEALALDVNDRLRHLVAAGLEPAHDSIFGADRITPSMPARLDLACADPRLAWLILPQLEASPPAAGAWSFHYRGKPMALIDCRSLRMTTGTGGQP